ncbi:MAG: DUF4933 domain-containing protein [Parabacteroides sp.]|nr:DUF4933 domain-containing protein [Parabacteroides sp.]
MNKQLLLILLPAILLATGCKQQKASDEGDTAMQTAPHQPLPPKYTAQYDRSIPPVRIDIEKASADSVPVNLSKVASSIEYFMVGDDKYPITDVVATNDGFIALNQPKLYLYRKGMKRKRVGLKTTFGNWINVPGPKICFDKTTTKLYAHLKRINQETGYGEPYIVELPPLDTVLARVYYLYPDSLPVSSHHFLPQKVSFLHDLSSSQYVTLKENKDGIDDGITTFNLDGDTLCSFPAGIDPTVRPGDYLYQPPFFDKIYRHDNRLTYRLSFCDTIYRVLDERTYAPAYVTDFGKSRLTALENIQGKDRKNKVWMTALEENAKALFIQTHKEGKNSKSGWLDADREPDMPDVERQIVYLKSSKQAFALPTKAGGLANDLDGGLPFWPDGQTDGYLYMIRPAKELKAKIKLTGSPKQKELKAFLDGVDEKQNVMIVVK